MQQCRHTTLHGLCLRSSSRMCSVRKVVLRNFAKLTGKHLCQSLFFNKVTGQRPATLLKKRFWYRCFLVDFGKFFKSTCFTEHLWTTAFVYLRIKFEDYRILIVIFVMKFSIVFVYDLKLRVTVYCIIFLQLQIQFGEFFHSMVLCRAGRDYY